MTRLVLMSKQRLVYLLVVGAIAVLMIFLYGQIDYTVEPYAQSDLYHYRLMAAAAPQLAPDVQQPYAFRILGPYLAGILAGQDPWGFGILTLAVALALGMVYFLFLTSWGIRSAVAAVTTALLLFNKHLFGYVVWDYFHVNDLLALLYLVILWWALRRARWLVFAVTLVLGALTRETALLMIPVALVYLAERQRLTRDWRNLLLAVLPGLLCFIILRLGIQPAGGQDVLTHFLRTSPKVMDPATWFRLLINAFIPVSLLPLIFPRHTLAFFRRNLAMLVYLLLVLASAFFGTDNERLMAPAAVIYYLLIATIIERYLFSSRLAVFVLLAGGFLSSWQHFIGRYPLPNRELTLVVSLGSLVVVSLVSLVVGYRRPPPAPPDAGQLVSTQQTGPSHGHMFRHWDLLHRLW